MGLSRALRRVGLVAVVCAGLSVGAAQGQGAHVEERDGWRAAAVVGAAAAAGVGTGFALGWRDGIANDARQRSGAAGYAANEAWHRAGWVTKPLLVLDVGGAVVVGGVVEPTAWEAVLLAASWGAGVGLGFHFGHNAQQGPAWDYFGTVDPSDGWARAVGPRVVVVTAVAVGVAVWVLTWRVLARF